MDPKDIPEVDLPDFDLEDIMREFSSQEYDLEDILQEFRPVPAPTPVQTGDDTIRMEPIGKAPAPAAEQDTMVFAPVAVEMPEEAEEEIPAPPTESGPEMEPFSDDWEPEYEEPMGEYTPKEPIPFPPKNRLRILRQKLVAGPERRYQELASAGLGKLQLGIFGNVILFAVAAAGTLVHHLGLVGEKMLQPLIFGQLVVILLSALVGCYRLLSGAGAVSRGKFTLNTLLLVTFFACTADGVFCLKYQRMPFAALFCLEMLMAQWSAYQQRSAEMGQMDSLRKASDLTAVVKIEEYYDGRPGYVSTPGEPEAFTAHYAAPSAPEKSLNRYGLLSLLIAAVLATVAGVRYTPAIGLQTFASALLIAVPSSAFISMTRPAAIAQRRLHKLGSVLCGWRGIQAAEKRAVYPVTGEDLFPADTVKMNGVKFYGAVDPGRVVSYTTALIAANRSGLENVFEQLPRGRSGLNHTVEEFTVYEGGVGGLVDGQNVLVGTGEFMAQMQVELPEGAKVPQAVYTAVEGSLSGVFAVSYSRGKSAAAGLKNLTGMRSVRAVFISSDFMLSPKFIREKLSVNIKRLEFPEQDVRQTLAGIEPDADAPVVALATKPGLAAKAVALGSACAMRSALKAGANVHIFGGLLGLVMVGALGYLGAMEILSPMNLLLYSLLWTVPGWLVTEWTRYL